MIALSPKDPVEQIFYSMDFSALLAAGETITSAQAALRVTSGADPAALLMLSGSPAITGGIVSQLIIDGVGGAVYLFSLRIVTSAGQTFIESAPLKVIERD